MSIACEKRMPTSSQALIILAVDGRLPKKTPRHTYPVMSVPYPLRDYNMTETCMTLENCNEDDADDVIKLLKQDRRLRDTDMSESLSEVLRISSFKGALTFDPVSRLLRWQINTEIPQSVRNEYTNHFENRLQFPNIHEKENMFLQKNQGYAKSSYMEKGQWSNINAQPDTLHSQQNLQNYSEQRAITLRKSVGEYPYHQMQGDNMERGKEMAEDADMFSEKERSYGKMDANTNRGENNMKRTVSLPSLFKARINKDLYQKLCSLGFRKPKEMKEEEKRNVLHRHKPPSDPTHAKAWDNETVTEDVENLEDKDFRLEDLSLKTDNLHAVNEGGQSMAAKLVHLFPNNQEYQKYLKERDAFYEKFDNYESYASTGTANITPRRKDDEFLTGYQRLPDIQQDKSRCDVVEDTTDYSKTKGGKETKKSLLEEVKEKSNYSKWKKRRLTTVRMRKEIPPSDPLCVCFNLPDNAMSHGEVKALVEDSCGGSVSEVQFDPVNVVAIDNDAPSRWIVRMRDMKSRDKFLQTGLIVDGERREVKLLDLLHQEEVDAYRFYELVQKGKAKLPGSDASTKRKKSKANY